MKYQKINNDIRPRLIDCPGCHVAPEFHRKVYCVRAWHGGRFYGKLCRVVCCSACGLTFLNPMFSAQDYADFYRYDYFQLQDIEDAAGEQRFVERMDTEMAHYLIPWIDEARMDLPENPRYLDVGAGYFPAVEIFARQGIVQKSLACALEPNVKAAAFLRRKFGIKACSDFLENNPYPPDSFDLVTALALIEHVTDPLKAIGDLRKVIAPNGLLLISTPALDKIALRQGPIRFFKVVHTLYFTENSLRDLLRGNGFEIVSLKVMPALNGYNVLLCLARKIDSRTANHAVPGNAMDEVRNIRGIIRCARREHPITWMKQSIRSILLGYGLRI